LGGWWSRKVDERDVKVCNSWTYFPIRHDKLLCKCSCCIDSGSFLSPIMVTKPTLLLFASVAQHEYVSWHINLNGQREEGIPFNEDISSMSNINSVSNNLYHLLSQRWYRLRRNVRRSFHLWEGNVSRPQNT